MNSAALASDWRTAIVDGNLRSVVRDQDGVVRHTDNPAFPQYPSHRALYFLAAEFIHDSENLIQVPADGLGFPQSQHGLGDGVDKDHTAPRIRGNHRVANTGERGTKRVPHLLTFFESRLLRQERISEVAVLDLNSTEHLVEAIGERAQFVPGELSRADAIVPGLRHTARGVGKLRNRLCDDRPQFR